MSLFKQLVAPMQAFVVAAGVSGCGSLRNIDQDTSTNSGRTIVRIQQTEPSDSQKKADNSLADAFKKLGYVPLPTDEGFERNHVDAYLQECALVPKNDFSATTHEWELDCDVNYSFWGVYLANYVLQLRHEKMLEQDKKSKSIPLTNVYTFTG